MSRENQGPLRNGNPRGDPQSAPRCGAVIRQRSVAPAVTAGEDLAERHCRQPAMANGRCRLHGGKSTGPNTEAGRAALRAARIKHGYYSAEARAFRDALNALLVRPLKPDR